MTKNEHKRNSSSVHPIHKNYNPPNNDTMSSNKTYIRILFPRNFSELLSIQECRSLYWRISGSKVSTFGVQNFPILVSYKFLASIRTIPLSLLGISLSWEFPGKKKLKIKQLWEKSADPSYKSQCENIRIIIVNL